MENQPRSKATAYRKRSGSKHKKKHSKKVIKPWIVSLFFIIPLLGLLIPYLIFKSDFNPALTDKMVDELVFVKYLINNNSHTFAEGWVSTKPFVPFSTRYFLTFFLNDYSSWQDALLKSVSCVYAIFSVSYLFFVSSFHAKKVYTYIILTIPGVILSVAGLYAVYDCSYLLTLFCPVLIVFGILLHGVRSKFPSVVRATLIILSIVPIVVIFLYMNNMKKEYSFDNTDLFYVDLSAKEEAEDITYKYEGLIDFLKSNGIKVAYCTDDINKEVSVIGNESVETAAIESPENPVPVETIEDSPENPFEKVSLESAPFYLICDKKSAKTYSESLTLKYSSTVYDDGYYTVYSYKNIDYYQNSVFQDNLYRLETSKYDCFYYSFLGSSIKDPGDFPVFYGGKPVFIHPCVKDFEDVNVLLDKAVAKSGLKSAIFEIDPIAFCAEEGKEEFAYLDKMIEENPKVFFHIILSYPSSKYWKSMSEDEMKKKLDNYSFVAEKLSHNENIKMYWPGNELWLIECSDNYIDEVPEENVALNVLTLCTCNEKYVTDKELVKDYGKMIAETVKKDMKYPNLSDREIVFFGDSIFGKYKAPLSIPGEIQSLSGAVTYNLGISGTTAIGEFNPVVNKFITGTETPFETPEYFRSEFERFKNEHDDSKKLTFVINYGVNDFFFGIPAKDEKDGNYKDYSYNSYESAMEDGIKKLKSAFPDAEICILSPIFCESYYFGKNPRSDVGSPLQEYRDTGEAIAEKYSVRWIDSLELMDIDEKNYKTYLVDGVHPTPDGIYHVSDTIIRFMEKE